MIELTNISKVFKIPHERRSGLKQAVIDFILRKKFDYEKFHALKDINLKINEGEFIGITGPNGSGKSTLLKIIAGILQPTTGKVKVNGKISSILELGTGFNGELTAKENVYLYGAVLGLGKGQLDRKFKKIIEFAELEKFVDTKLKNFSSGMYARLAFAIAIQVDAPILLVDEVLAVGDIQFQQKCFKVFERFKKEGKTIVLVSHSMNIINRFCDKVIQLDEGNVREINKVTIPNEQR